MLVASTVGDRHALRAEVAERVDVVVGVAAMTTKKVPCDATNEPDPFPVPQGALRQGPGPGVNPPAITGFGGDRLICRS